MHWDTRQLVDGACEKYGDAAIERLRNNAKVSLEYGHYDTAANECLAASILRSYLYREQTREEFAQILDGRYTGDRLPVEFMESRIMTSIVGTAMEHAMDSTTAYRDDSFDAAAADIFKNGHVPYFSDSVLYENWTLDYDESDIR